MTTTTTTTTDETKSEGKAPALTADMIRAIGRDVASFSENVQSNQRQAFTQICGHAEGLVANVAVAYAAVNAQQNEGKTTRTNISAARFADLFVSAAGTLNIKVPSKAEVRELMAFANEGTDEAVREHFLLVVAKTGAFKVTFSDYVRYLGKRDHYAPSGNLSKVGREALAARTAERTTRTAVKEAAKTARPVAYDWSTAYTNSEGGDATTDPAGYVTWLMLMQAELSATIDIARKGMSRDDVKSVAAEVATRILAGKQA